MDKTPIYIKMCKKAKKIQALRAAYEDWEDGDYYFDPSSKSGADLFCSGCIDERWTGEQYRLFKGKAIWLPRQDELQEMLNTEFGMQLYDLDNLVEEGDWHHIESMEQLWLAFVMKEKYGKVWDNTAEEWVAYGDKG